MIREGPIPEMGLPTGQLALEIDEERLGLGGIDECNLPNIFTLLIFYVKFTRIMHAHFLRIIGNLWCVN
ncbi:unnamed protein product [Moneuplotes crassus]|uniref:Uncharacterized protein n=1 Tax=Euplotes crassus TaxID=5936 RepID=A0AAD1XV20_EUPCR|nr:unnamed protein product [Moneuplotes crassus]